MKDYLITITFNDPFPKPTEFREKAGGFATAISRAIRKWRSLNKGRRVKEITIKATTL